MRPTKNSTIAATVIRASGGAKVVAAGCLAERYGSGLAEALPEAQVLSFDDYGDIAARLDAVLAVVVRLTVLAVEDADEPLAMRRIDAEPHTLLLPAEVVQREQ